MLIFSENVGLKLNAYDKLYFSALPWLVNNCCANVLKIVKCEMTSLIVHY